MRQYAILVKTGAWLCVVLFGLLSTLASATIRYVDPNNPNPTAPYTSWSFAATNIQDAIDVASPGDQVLVTNGIYQTGGRAGGDWAMTRVVITNLVTLQSVNGATATVIDGGGVMRCVYLADSAVLSGFTLRNGNVGTGGGGVRCATFSNEVVATCLILSNTAHSGGGIWQGTVSNSIIAWNNASSSSDGGAESCLLNNCILSNNTAGFFGGGASDGVSALNNCLVLGNTSQSGGGGVYGSTLNNCLVLSNTCRTVGMGGGTLQCILNNCTICGNSGPGVEMASGFGLVPQANNCIIYYNSPPGAGANVTPGATLHYCCTTPLPAGTGNITNAPLFANFTPGDFHLSGTSPCINSGKNAYVTAATDLDGNPRISGGTVDIGAYELQNPPSIISYAWLYQYGLLIDGFDDFTDPDGDGMNNWQEWICGTDPTNAASVFENPESFSRHIRRGGSMAQRHQPQLFSATRYGPCRAALVRNRGHQHPWSPRHDCFRGHQRNRGRTILLPGRRSPVIRLAWARDQSRDLPAAFAFLHLALATAANFAFAAADIRRLGLAPVAPPALLKAAHRFRTPARIAARPFALSFLRSRFPAFGSAVIARKSRSWFIWF